MEGNKFIESCKLLPEEHEVINSRIDNAPSLYSSFNLEIKFALCF
jgi:hypothetical protein